MPKTKAELTAEDRRFAERLPYDGSFWDLANQHSWGVVQYNDFANESLFRFGKQRVNGGWRTLPTT